MHDKPAATSRNHQGHCVGNDADTAEAVAVHEDLRSFLDGADVAFARHPGLQETQPTLTAVAAADERKGLARIGIGAEVDPAQVGEKTGYRVRVAGFDKAAQAQSFGDHVAIQTGS